MSIEKDEIVLDNAKRLHELVDELIEENELYVGRKHHQLLRKWIISNNGNLFDFIDFRRAGIDNPLIPKDQTLVIPADKISILEIICDIKIDRRQIGKELTEKIGVYHERREAKSVTYGGGNIVYEFYIKIIDGFPQVNYKINGGDAGEYSDGKFITFKSSDNLSIIPEGRIGKFAKESVSDEEEIFIEMIAADNNRVFCCGKQKKGREITYRFFWSQMEDEFPAEPGGESLPGVYVMKRTSKEEQVKRYNEIIRKFEGNLNQHPAWVMQLFGGKIAELSEAPLVPKKIKSTIKDINDVMPVIVEPRRWYEISLDTSMFEEVYDIGVANPHRYEHYKTEIGGEVMSFIYDSKLEDYKSGAQKLGFTDIIPSSHVSKQVMHGVLQNAFPNFKVHDGMGFNDGTCNFFVLAKIKSPGEGGFKGEELYQQGKCALLWCDEQEYFSQRWRIMHPDDCEYGGTAIGTYTSVFPVIKWYYTGLSVGQISELINIERRGKINKDIYKFIDKFKASLPYDEIDEYSRISTARSATVMTTKDKIYSISAMWGVADFGWNERNYPKDQVVFPDTISFRDDMTIHMCGYCKKDDSYIPGYWYQKYLPPTILQNNYCTEHYSQEPFKHPWQFVSQEVFEAIEKYYNFGVYDGYYDFNNVKGEWFPFRKDRGNYAYKGIDEKSQYYKIKIEPEHKLEAVKELINEGVVEWEPYNRNVHNPFFAFYKGKKNISLTLRWDAVLDSLIAVYTHPWDDDILANMEADGFLTELIKSELNHDLRGEWRPKDSDENEEEGYVNLGTIYFKPNKAEFRDVSQEEKLRRLADNIRQFHSNGTVNLKGHCAKITNENRDVSLKLSAERAEVVKEFIVGHILSGANKYHDKSLMNIADKIICGGFASDLPDASNETEAGKKQNRRVEILIETKHYFFKVRDRQRNFSPPSVKKVKLKKKGNAAEVTFTTNDESIRYITIGAKVGDEARPISRRFQITKNTAELFEIANLREQFKEQILYVDDITCIEDLKKLEEFKIIETTIRDLFVSMKEVRDKQTIKDFLLKRIPVIATIKRVKELQDTLKTFQDKAKPEPLPDPVDITVTIPLLSVGNSDDFFKEDSHILHGTSVWFEDIQGHKAIAEELEIEEG